jgi:hypothetical protein
MFVMGLLSTYVYRCAIHDSCWAVFTLGAFIYATVMTIFSEEYFAQIMFWIKAGALSTLVYFTPSIIPSISRFALPRRTIMSKGEPEPCE